MNDKILVIGGTGAMGSAVVEHLLQTPGRAVVVPTRDADAVRAKELLSLTGPGIVELVEGDLNDTEWLTSVMAGVDAVFCNTNFFAANSPVAEYELGRTIINVAHEHRVAKFIWSSLDDALTLTRGAIAVPHYDSKAAVAAYINLQRSEEMMAQVEDGWFTHNVSILTTAPYYENLTTALAPSRGALSDGRDGLTFALPFGEGAYPMIALSDIGWFASFMFDAWQSWGSPDLAVVGDRLTGLQIAYTFEQRTGLPSEYQDLPLEVIIASVPVVGHDLAAMSAFFQARDVATTDRDLEHLRSIHPGLRSFDEWLAKSDWQAPTSTH